MYQRSFVVLTLCALCAFFLLREQDRGTFSAVDDGHLSWLQATSQSAKPRPRAAPVVLLQCDDVNKAPEERLLAEDWVDILKGIAAQKPRALAVEPALVWAEFDPNLQAAVEALPRCALGAVVRRESSSELAAESPVDFPLPELPRIRGDVTPLPEFNIATAIPQYGKPEWLGITHVDLGGTGNRLRIEGDVCIVPLLYQHGGKAYPSLTLQILAQECGIPVSDAEVLLGHHIAFGGTLQVPIDSRGAFHYHLFRTNIARLDSLKLDTFRLSARDIERFAPKEERELMKRMEGAICYVGSEDKARALAWPDGTSVTSSSLTAHALRAMLSGKNFRPASPLQQWIFLGCVVLFAAWLAGRTRRRILAGAFLGGLLVLTATLLAFESGEIWLALTPAMLTLALGAGAALIMAPARARQKAG